MLGGRKGQWLGADSGQGFGFSTQSSYYPCGAVTMTAKVVANIVVKAVWGCEKSQRRIWEESVAGAELARTAGQDKWLP